MLIARRFRQLWSYQDRIEMRAKTYMPSLHLRVTVSIMKWQWKFFYTVAHLYSDQDKPYVDNKRSFSFLKKSMNWPLKIFGLHTRVYSPLNHRSVVYVIVVWILYWKCMGFVYYYRACARLFCLAIIGWAQSKYDRSSLAHMSIGTQ